MSTNRGIQVLLTSPGVQWYAKIRFTKTFYSIYIHTHK